MRFVIVALCAVGLFVSARMQRKAEIARRGQLAEPSVVQTPRATLVGDVPNSTLGIAYYVLLAVAMIFFSLPGVRLASLIAAIAAAAMSVYLAYSLIFVTKMPCTNCWTGHVVNWLLLALLASGAVQ